MLWLFDGHWHIVIPKINFKTLKETRNNMNVGRGKTFVVLSKKYNGWDVK